MRRWLAALALWLTAAAPTRVVSLNLCADDYLLLLAPGRAVAVTRLAADPDLSVVAAAAERLPAVRPVAEAVMAFHPDLVLAANGAAALALDRLAARGVPVERVDLTAGFPAIRAETRRLGHLLDADARAQALLAAMDATLAAIEPKPGRVVALYPAFYTSGPGGMMDAAIRAAGGTQAGTGRTTLEGLLADPPDLVLVAPSPAPSLSAALLDHPALRQLRRREVPAAWTLCAGPWSAEAARRIAQP